MAEREGGRTVVRTEGAKQTRHGRQRQDQGTQEGGELTCESRGDGSGASSVCDGIGHGSSIGRRRRAPGSARIGDRSACGLGWGLGEGLCDRLGHGFSVLQNEGKGSGERGCLGESSA